MTSLLRKTGRSVASFRYSYFWFFILALPYFVYVNVFAFCEASTSNVFFSKKSNPVVGGISNKHVLYYKVTRRPSPLNDGGFLYVIARLSSVKSSHVYRFLYAMLKIYYMFPLKWLLLLYIHIMWLQLLRNGVWWGSNPK